MTRRLHKRQHSFPMAGGGRLRFRRLHTRRGIITRCCLYHFARARATRTFYCRACCVLLRVFAPFPFQVCRHRQVLLLPSSWERTRARAFAAAGRYLLLLRFVAYSHHYRMVWVSFMMVAGGSGAYDVPAPFGGVDAFISAALPILVQR